MPTARLDRWGGGETIPLKECLRQKKWAKYFDRRSGAALVSIHRLLAGRDLPENASIHWALGDLEFQDYGLESIRQASRGGDGAWDSILFAREGMTAVSPLTQFKVLYNMPLCLSAMELGLTGDNTVVHGLDEGLLLNAAAAPPGIPVLLGAIRCLPDGGLESAVALALPEEIPLQRTSDILEFLSGWAP